MERWKFDLMEFDRKCFKFLISINFLFPYKIMKVIKNISINILGYKKKKLWDRDRLIKILRDG